MYVTNKNNLNLNLYVSGLWRGNQHQHRETPAAAGTPILHTAPHYTRLMMFFVCFCFLIIASEFIFFPLTFYMYFLCFYFYFSQVNFVNVDWFCFWYIKK